MAAAAANMAKVVLLLLFVMQLYSVLAAAGRPLAGDGQWLENGIGMVTQMLGGVKSRSNPRTHCC
jgi:hypothetical protein